MRIVYKRRKHNNKIIKYIFIILVEKLFFQFREFRETFLSIYDMRISFDYIK